MDEDGNCELIYALVGALAMLAVLFGIGITQPRGTSTLVWCFFYLLISIVFDGLVVVALFYQNAMLIELLLGLSAGAATGLGIHVTHHVLDERKDTKPLSMNH